MVAKPESDDRAVQRVDVGEAAFDATRMRHRPLAVDRRIEVLLAE
jgi:hypothetical protein